MTVNDSPWPPPPTLLEALSKYGSPDNPYAHPTYIIPTERLPDGTLRVIDPTKGTPCP